MKGRAEHDFYQSIGARIRIAREVRGLTQGQLGKAIGLTRTSIINIEQGRQGLPLHGFVRLADYLGVSFRLLLLGESERGRNSRTAKPNVTTDSTT